MSKNISKERAERCVTHSYACDCREYRFKNIEHIAIDLIKRLYYSDERIFYDWIEVSNLMDAVGFTIKDIIEVKE